MTTIRWNIEAVMADVEKASKDILGEMALRMEGHAKRELRKGRGVLTGTLRRSIHTAPPGYGWNRDNVNPGNHTPELGGKITPAEATEKGLVVAVGSGMSYALAVHQGHGKFKGYHFLTNGFEKAKKELGQVIAKHVLKGK